MDVLLFYPNRNIRKIGGSLMDYSIISRHRAKLMGVAALWIYVFHILPAPAFSNEEGLELIWWYFRRVGFCGVDMFLFLSGLGLTYSMEKHPVAGVGDCLRFWAQRFYRIYVVFLPFAVIFALLDGWGIGLFLRRLVCLDQFGNKLYNFCWYVCCILLLYLLSPGLYRLVRRGPAAMVSGAVYLGLLLMLRGVLREDLYAIAVRLPVFVLGLWVGRLSLEKRTIGWIDWAVSGVMLVVGVVLSFGLNANLISSPLPAGNALVNILLVPGLILALCVVFTWMEDHRWATPIGKCLIFFGGISFEFYLLQEWYVRRGIVILPATGKLRHVLLLCVMTALSVLLQCLSNVLKRILARR